MTGGAGPIMLSKNVMWGILAVAAGAGLAAVFMPHARSRWASEPVDDQSDRVDEASEESFPASDPPAHSA
jgi:hypothetical protein